ncbi:hypothetical protein VB773_13670 [Haloarculaceae archaeon H-GB2-1]|nr:hypothetical protein [Haloarculaceae archaeon H-GB1-1]MEA5387011.1 hypothetical protein [Haloarculaceae archaeon H-GB11]MEA5408513.1 hypothetical protein [Haloarculaceae archaeon H-GB2-1]
MKRDPEWGVFDLALFTLFLVVVFLAVPIAVGIGSVLAGFAVLSVEIAIVGIYELGLMGRYKRTLSRTLPGQAGDEWERRNL